MLSGVRPYSERSYPVVYWACSVVADCWTCYVVPSGLTGLLNWLTYDWPADPPNPSMFGFPKMM